MTETERLSRRSAMKALEFAIRNVEPRGAHCMVGGIRLHYLDFDIGAQGTPLFVLPGITSPAATWAFVASNFACQRRVVVADIRGRGLSESRPSLGYSLDDYAADAIGMMAAADLKAPIVVGHSMGARIAIRLAARFPSSVSQVILADPPLSGPGRAPYPTPLSSYLRAHGAASRGARIEEFRAYTPDWSDEQIATRLQWLPTCSIEAIAATHAHFHSEDIFVDLPKIKCPAMLMRATRAAVVSAAAADEVVSLLKYGSLCEIDAGHMIPWDNLDSFVHQINMFIGNA